MAAFSYRNGSDADAAVRDGWNSSSIFCFPMNKELNYRGIWYGDNPFDFVYPTVLAKIVLVSFISRLLHWLLRPLKQPKFVCYVLGGIILGPTFFGRNRVYKQLLFPPRENELLLTMALIGGIYSVFLVGVKMDKVLIVRSVKNAWKIGLFGFLSSFAVGACLIFQHLSNFTGFVRGAFVFYVPLSLSYTFFPVLTQALEELNLLNSELGQLAMSSAVLNDIIFWFFLALSNVFRHEKMNQAVEAMCSLVILVVFTLTVIRRLVLSVIKSTPVGKPIKEIYITFVLLGVLVMALVSSSLGVTSILGSLLLGLVIPGGPPFGSAIVVKTESIVSEFLMPMFFVQVGYTTDLKAIHNWPVFIKFQIVIALAYFAKFLGTFLASLACKIRFKSALMLGLMMNIKGILELIHYHRWKSNRYIDEQTYAQFVLSVLGVTMIVTPLIRYLCTPDMRFNTSFKHRGFRALRSMPRNTEFRILCIIHNEESVHSIITLLEASNPTDASPICAYIVQASELIGLAAPVLVPYDKQRRKLKLSLSASTDQIVRAFENYSNNSRGPVVIMPFIMVAYYKTMHESVCRLAQEKFISLIIVPFHQNLQYRVGSNAGAGLRQINTNVQLYAPCTVGILVDRGFSCRKSSSHFAYHVMVIFIGGPDDREALAYATRMSNQQREVMVTVVQIVLQTKKECTNEEQQKEVNLDESVAEEFKLKNIGNASAVWHEVEVEEEAEVMNVIRSVKGHYDLVMVGRRRSWDMSMGEEEMAFVEKEELGVIGDMLASSDFCGGMVSVLVMQHHMREDTRRSNSINSNKSNSGR